MSVNAIQYKSFDDFMRQVTKNKVTTPPPAIQKADSFEKIQKSENKFSIKGIYKYLTEPIENPEYKKGVYGAKPTTSRIQKYSGYALATALYGFFIFYMIRMMKITGFEKKTESVSSFLNKYKEDLSRASKLEDLALPDVLEGTVKRLLNKIKNPFNFIQKGGTNVKTILLYGPPGTGKTTVARAITKEIDGGELFSVDLSTIQGKYMGESQANLDKIIRSICKYAKENPYKKVVVLMDEVDSVAIKDNGSSNQQYHASLLDVLKRGISEKLVQHDNVILIATTNAELNKTNSGEFIQKLDSAIADRFDERIRVDRPTQEQFMKALAHHYKGLNVDSALKDETSQEVRYIAKRLADNKCSFRTLNNVYNAAASANENPKLSVQDVYDVLDTCIQSSKDDATRSFRIKGFGVE